MLETIVLGHDPLLRKLVTAIGNGTGVFSDGGVALFDFHLCDNRGQSFTEVVFTQVLVEVVRCRPNRWQLVAQQTMERTFLAEILPYDERFAFFSL